uniref:Uncharacterized protein n=1 Tax=Solanum lycopersicum TaxID=4081 RepID=A0A3Q7GE76_SOLLC
MVCISISNLTLLSISTLSSSKVDIADNAASTTSTLSWCKQDSSLSTALASIKQKLSSAEQTPRWTEHNGIVFLLTNARLSVMFWWGSFARRVAETACFSVIRGLSDGLGNGRRGFGILHKAYQDSNKSYKGCIPAQSISTLYHFDQNRRNSFSNIDYVVRSKHDFPETSSALSAMNASSKKKTITSSSSSAKYRSNSNVAYLIVLFLLSSKFPSSGITPMLRTCTLLYGFLRQMLFKSSIALSIISCVVAEDNAALAALILAVSFLSFHSFIVAFNATLVLRFLLFSFWPDFGHIISSRLLSDLLIHSDIASLSYVTPLSIVTGSSIIFFVKGQKNVSYRGSMYSDSDIRGKFVKETGLRNANLYCQTCPYPQWLNYNERVRNSSLIERWAKRSVEAVGGSLKLKKKLIVRLRLSHNSYVLRQDV